MTGQRLAEIRQTRAGPPWRRFAVVAATTLVILTILAACGGQATPPTTPEGVSPAPTAGGTVVEVTLTEWRIDMPPSLPAGMTTFEVTNAGTFVHNFRIVGQGIEKQFDSNLQPGETNTMQVELKAGSYEVDCPVAGHADQGMRLELTVTGT